MADIKVVIQLQDTVEDIIEKLGSSTKVNNASIQKTSGSFGYLSTKSDGINMKSWAKQTYKNGEYVGSLSLADGYVGGANTKLVEQYGYNGYVFGAVPESKQLTVTLEVRGENIDSIIIYGDKNANQFPTKAYRDGDPNDIIYSDDATWAIKFDSPLGSHSITFLEWNRANYNACITYIAELKNKLYLDKSWVKSVESLSQSTGQPKEIYYGLTPSSGTLEIIDINGEIKDYLQDGILEDSNVDMRLYASENLVHTHISTDSNYLQDGTLSVTLNDKLSQWDNIEFEGFSLDTSTISLITLLSSVLSRVQINLTRNMFNPSTLYDRVSGIFIQYSYMLSSSIRQALDKICEVAQLNIALGDNGDIKIFDARPIIDKNTSVICVPSKMQYHQPYRDIIKKNNYDKVVVHNNSISYDYLELVQIPFATYEMPNFTYLKDEDGKRLSKVDTRVLSDFKSVHEDSNKDLEFLAYNIPYVSGNYSYNRYSLSKFTINKPDIISDFANFKLSLVSKSLTQVAGTNESGNNARWLVDTSENNQTTNVFIKSSENEIIRQFFNLDSLGNIVSAKDIGMYALGVVRRSQYLDFYVFKQDVITDWETGEVNGFGDYSGTIIISVKGLNIERNSYIKGDGNNVITLRDDNELITNKGYHEGVYGDSVRATLAQNILDDYKNGISVAELTVSCLDMFDINGNKVKDFSNGEVIEVGDVVRVDKDNNGNSLWSYKDGSPMYWRVTGRNFRKVGVPMIDLELQEVVGIEYKILTFPSGVNVYQGNTKLSSGQRVIFGSTVTIESIDVDFEYLLIDGKQLSIGSKIIVNSDINIQFGTRVSFGDEYNQYPKIFTFSGSTGTQEYIYNPNNYQIINDTISIWISDEGQSINLPYSGEVDISGMTFNLVADSQKLLISNQSSSLNGVQGFVECEVIAPIA